MFDSFREFVDRARVGFALAADSVRAALRAGADIPPQSAMAHDEFIVVRGDDSEAAELAAITKYEEWLREHNTPDLVDPAELDFAMLHPEEWPSVRAASDSEWRKAAREWRKHECDNIQAGIYRAQESAGAADSNPQSPRLNLQYAVSPIRVDGSVTAQSWRK